MLLKQLEVGPLMVNCYIVGCEKTRQAAVIDPGDETERIIDMAKEMNLEIKQIINTHGHMDHIAGNSDMKRITGAEIFIHPEDADMLTSPRGNMSVFFGVPVDSPAADNFLEEGDTHVLGKLEFQVLHVPGHSPGSVCLVIDNIAIVGDTLFNGSIGRTDFPGGSLEQLTDNIHRKIFALDDSTKILPGHGPATTVGRERRHNPFLT